MKTQKTYGLTAQRLGDYFNAESAFSARGGGWAYKDCEITVTPLEPQRLSGVVVVPRTAVSVEGDARQAAEVFDVLFIRFLSVGG